MKVLQSLYQNPQLYMKNASWLENVQFTVADVNQDDKTERLFLLQEKVKKIPIMAYGSGILRCNRLIWWTKIKQEQLILK